MGQGVLKDRFALWSFRSPPFPRRHSRASTSRCSSLPSEPRNVPGNYAHRKDTGYRNSFFFARSAVQHGTNPDDASISSQTRCALPLAIHLRHATGSPNRCLVLDRSAGESLAPASLHTIQARTTANPPLVTLRGLDAPGYMFPIEGCACSVRKQ
jgi:hypothetical protein